MRTIRVTYANGQKITTDINGTDAEIWNYYMARGQVFDLGDPIDPVKDNVQRAVNVEFLDKIQSAFTMTEDALTSAIFCQCSLETTGAGTMAEARQQARRMLAADRALSSLSELTSWMREHCGPSDGIHDMLMRASAVMECTA